MGATGNAPHNEYSAIADGCWVHDRCLDCPLPACKDDEAELWPGGAAGRTKALRERWDELKKVGNNPFTLDRESLRLTKKQANERRQQQQLAKKQAQEEAVAAATERAEAARAQKAKKREERNSDATADHDGT